MFPEKTNVTFAQVEDKKNIKINVWERGAGLQKHVEQLLVQQHCCILKKKLTENKVNIRFKEGILNIEIDKTKYFNDWSSFRNKKY